MRNLSRKALSVVMSLVLVVGLCPGLAYAGEGRLSPGGIVLESVEGLSVQSVSSGGYVWPLREAGYTSGYTSSHGAIDISNVAYGSDVLAVKDGTVKYVQTGYSRTPNVDENSMASYGNCIMIYHPDGGTCTLYAHLSSVKVSAGNTVKRGQVIGSVGNSGRTLGSTGTHLHFELRTGANASLGNVGKGTRVNPLNYVSQSNIYNPSTDDGGGITSIADGVYTVHSAIDRYKVLDVENASKDELANLRLWTSNCNADQQFRFQRYSDGSYKITNVGSGKALDVESGSTADKANVRQYTPNDSNAQRWYIEDAGNGQVRFRGKGSNKYLDVNGASSADGTNVQIYTKNTSKAQIFELSSYAEFGERTTSLSDGYYVMLSACDKTYAVDANGGSTASGTNLQLWGELQNDAQVFHIAKQADGYYRISPQATDDVVFDVDGGGMPDGKNVRLYSSNNSYAQRWILRDCGNGQYAFQCVGTGKFLDAYGGKAANGVNLNQWIGNGTNAQKFFLVPWDRSMAGNRIRVQGISDSYPETGQAIAPLPNLTWLANSFDSIRVPESGEASGGYSNRRIADLKANRTYVVEIANATRLAGSAPYGQVRAVSSDGLDTSPRGTVQWSGGKQTITMVPTKDCSLYIYPAVAADTKGNAAQFEDIKIYEQLIAETDYSVVHANNVNAGTATVTLTGKGTFSGSKAMSFAIVAKPAPVENDPTPTPVVLPEQNTVPGGGTNAGPSNEVPGGGTNAEPGNEMDGLARYAGVAESMGFTDLDAGAWYMTAGEGKGSFPDSAVLYIDYTIGRGLMSGYAGTTRFGPDDALSRGMAATIIYRMATGVTADTTDNNVATKFVDVPSGQWYAAAVKWCAEKGVVTGYTDGSQRFDPNGNVTREQLAAMIARYCENVGGMPAAGGSVSIFKDGSQVSSWAREGVSFCSAHGVVSGVGSSGYFDPWGKATRCQMAKIIAVTARLME